MRPTLSIVPISVLQAGGLALAHGRWRLAVVENGSRVELSGLGTMVSRRGAQGNWRVALDNPLTGP